MLLLFLFSFFSGYRDFTDPYEPFAIPEHLRRQREEFEAVMGYSNSNSYNQRVLDQTREVLYEYVYVSVLDSLKALILLY